jgi:hypothetical protein
MDILEIVIASALHQVPLCAPRCMIGVIPSLIQVADNRLVISPVHVP